MAPSRSTTRLSVPDREFCACFCHMAPPRVHVLVDGPHRSCDRRDTMSSIDIPVGAFAPSLGGSVALPQDRSAARLVPVRERFRRTLLALADQYPDSLQPDQRRDVPRHTFQIERIYRPGAVLADLGGGIGLFSPACATLGMETWLVDDLRDP